MPAFHNDWDLGGSREDRRLKTGYDEIDAVMEKGFKPNDLIAIPVEIGDKKLFTPIFCTVTPEDGIQVFNPTDPQGIDKKVFSLNTVTLASMEDGFIVNEKMAKRLMKTPGGLNTVLNPYADDPDAPDAPDVPDTWHEAYLQKAMLSDESTGITIIAGDPKMTDLHQALVNSLGMAAREIGIVGAGIVYPNSYVTDALAETEYALKEFERYYCECDIARGKDTFLDSITGKEKPASGYCQGKHFTADLDGKYKKVAKARAAKKKKKESKRKNR